MKAFTLALFALLAALPGSSLAEVAGTAASVEPVRLRPSQVRAFAAESDRVVVVREGRDLYRRVSTRVACPELLDAERIGFQTGTVLKGVDNGMTTVATVDRAHVPTVLSPTTPHATLVVGRGEARTACPMASIAEARAADFEAARAVNGSHDIR